MHVLSTFSYILSERTLLFIDAIHIDDDKRLLIFLAHVSCLRYVSQTQFLGWSF